MKIVPVPNYYFEHPDYYDDKRDVRNIWEEECVDIIEEEGDDAN